MTDEPDVRDPHNALFVRTFHDAGRLEVELRRLLPPALVEQLDFGTLQLESGTLVAPDLRSRFSDLIATVELGGRRALMYLLFEHMSTVHKLMALRFLGYLQELLTRHVGLYGEELPLPVVLPMLLHHSETGWTAATSFHELFDPELLALDGVRQLVPDFRFLLDDVSHASDADLRSRAFGHAGRIVALTLLAMRDARSLDRLSRSFAQWADLVTEILEAPTGRDALQAVLSYVLQVGDEASQRKFVKTVVEAVPETRELVMTLAQKWKNEGRLAGEKDGRLAGEKDGLKRGREEGERLVLEKLLTLKFRELPAAARERLGSATTEELDLWAERILTATTLEEVLR